MNKIKNKLKEKCILRVSCTRTIEGSICQTLSSYIEQHNLNLISMNKDEVTKDEVKLVVTIITSRPDEVDNLVKALSAEVGVTSLSWKHSKYYQADNEDDTSEE